MKRALQSDLKRLQKLAFRRAERCGAILKQFHANRSKIDSHPASLLIWRTYDWLCIPLSLWPIDFDGFVKHLLNLVETKSQFDDDLLLLLNLIGNPPDKETCNAVGAFEHMVETGNYEHLVRRPEKFAELETTVKHDQELATAWKQIKKRWDIKSHQNPRGVIRRRMSQERNFRENWEFDWKDAKKKFFLFFDTMCYRWKLYGMEHDEPLLLKISVNPTPHGTMIVIPRHWSLDPIRDLDWNKIGKLHRSRGATRQGPKLSVSRMQKREEAIQVKKIWDEAGIKKIRGDARYDYVLKKMRKVDRTDYSWVKRLLRLARGKLNSL
jgi:hypothetical protein